jgi:hypothetical protein
MLRNSLATEEAANAKHVVHGGGALQEQGCRFRLSPLPRSRPYGPRGLVYLSSWVDDKFERCYQLMATEDDSLLDKWMANGAGLVNFEVHRVVTSQEAAESIVPNL